MHARNRHTKSPIKGTLEDLQGYAKIDPATFERDESGKIAFEHNGTTEIDWNAQRTRTRRGEPIFIDENGHEVATPDLELYEPN